MRTQALWYQSAILVLGLFALGTQVSCSTDSGVRSADNHAAVPDDHLVVPDWRIGPFKLGMTDEELFKTRIPTGTRPDAIKDHTVYYFGNRTVFVNSSHRVDVIYTWDKADRTSAGVGVGSSLPDFFRSFGPPTDSVAGNDVCGVPGQIERVYYQHGNMQLGFSKRYATCADVPTKRVQSLAIKYPYSDFF